MSSQPLDVLAQQIDEAWCELLGARADYEHSPNADTEQTRDYAELRMNRLVERLFAAMTAEQKAAAEARPVRVMETAG